MKRKARAFLSLSRKEKALLLEAWCLLLAADVGLRLLPWKRVERLLDASLPARRGARLSPARLAWLVETAARHHLVAMTCLRRALVLRRLLLQRGVSGVLRLGVCREQGEVLAHAWVEVDHRPLGENLHVARRFAPLLASPIR